MAVTKTSGRKTKVIDLLITKMMDDKHPRVKEDLADAFNRMLPYNYKFVGDVPKELEDKKLDGSSKLEPTILLVVHFTMYSWGKVLQALYEDTYESIVIFDPDIHDFDIPRMLNDLVMMSNYRDIQRLGTQFPEKIVKKMNTVKVIPYGSEVPKALLNLGGDMDISEKRENVFAKNFKILNQSYEAKEAALKASIEEEEKQLKLEEEEKSIPASVATAKLLNLASSKN